MVRLAVLFLTVFALKAAAVTPVEPLDHHGYVEDIQFEREQVVRPLSIPSKPAEEKGMNITEKIFDLRLSSEFRERYQAQFGRTTSEQNLKFPSRYNYYFGGTTRSSGVFERGSFRGDEVERDRATRDFGNYMFKRLGEYHFDKYLQERPVVQKVYEYKKKLSNVKLEVSPGVEIKAKYDFSGNFLTLDVVNPWLKKSVLVEMDPSNFGPTEPREIILTMTVPMPLEVSMDTYVRFMEGSIEVVGRKQLNSELSATLTGKLDSRLDHLDPKSDREDLLLSGLAWVY